MALDTSTYAAVLKKFYTPQRMQNMVYKKNAFFAMLPKSSKLPGSTLEIPIIYEDSQNRSADFATAQAGATNLKTTVYSVTPASDYGLAVISGEVIRAAESDEGAFMRASTAAINSVVNGLTRSWAAKTWRQGYGDLGTVTYTSGKSFTCTNIADVVHFGIGQPLVFRADLATSALRSATAALVTAVNRVTGVVTTDTTLSGISVTTGDYVYVKGDTGAGATPARQCVTGFMGWVPQAAPSSATFFGVDRSVDPTRLGGLRQSSIGQPIEEALIDAAELAGREGWGLSHYFCNFTEYANLLKALSAKVEIEIKTDMPDVGFSGVRVWGPRGAITVVPDQNIPAALIAGVSMDSWLLRSRGEPIGVLDDDGLTMLRSATADAYEIRYGGYGNLVCNAPGANIHIQRA